CQLAGQRWRATDEAVSEEVGVEVHTEEAAPQPPMMNTNPHTPGTPPAEPVLNAGETLEKPNQEEEPPLTEEELAAFRGLSEPNRERMEQHRAEVEQALRAAADLDGESGAKVPRSDENVVANAKVEDITALLKEEEEALEDDGLVMNAGNPCRAKNPGKCHYHGGFENPLVGKTGNAKSLGLPDFSSAEVKGEPSLKRTKSKVADALMRGGIEVKTVDGDSVTFNGEVPDHWLGLDGKQPKTRKERDKRYSRLGDALRATVYPHEIWEHHGKKVYVRKYRTPDGKNFTMAGVIKENGVARTYYWDKPEEMEKTRQGKLLYCRTK
ncbi:MAG: hypothetical protein IKY91_03440, partial [Akkermansia sp.]|nr:hypothetical protein [Akkermansia sp.]